MHSGGAGADIRSRLDKKAILISLLLLAVILISLIVIGVMIWRLRKPPHQ
jgi:hypothetical protein